MELKEKINQNQRNFSGILKYQFSGILKCQFCGHEELLRDDYDDEYCHNEVIPNFVCPKCKKSTIGENDVMRAHTPKYPEGCSDSHIYIGVSSSNFLAYSYKIINTIEKTNI